MRATSLFTTVHFVPDRAAVAALGLESTGHGFSQFARLASAVSFLEERPFRGTHLDPIRAFSRVRLLSEVALLKPSRGGGNRVIERTETGLDQKEKTGEIAMKAAMRAGVLLVVSSGITLARGPLNCQRNLPLLDNLVPNSFRAIGNPS
jgi:hypothetical protein